MYWGDCIPWAGQLLEQRIPDCTRLELRTEKELSDDLFHRLLDNGIDIFKEITMTCRPHMSLPAMSLFRIDYVAIISEELIGIEVKPSPKKMRDLGSYFSQALQYGSGIITNHPKWKGRSLQKVFIYTPLDRDNSILIWRHYASAQRLFGPSNVGFIMLSNRGLVFRLSAENYWQEAYPTRMHASLKNKTYPFGSGRIQIE